MTALLSYMAGIVLSIPLLVMPHRERTNTGHQDSGSIPIGLLVPDSTNREAAIAAQMAVEEANHQGGLRGIPFKLVVRSTEGPWGAGSKESVSLVYEDHVVAFVGALDGRNGHLAEQVATKSHLTYLETRATESTLSQAFVPYFMRVLPNDDQQAIAILERIEEQGSGKVAVVYNPEYDPLNAARSFTRIAGREGFQEPLLIPFESPGAEPDPAGAAEILLRNAVNHLVITYVSEATIALIQHARSQLPDIQLYGTLGLNNGLPPGDPAWQSLEGIHLISPGFDPVFPGLHSPGKDLPALYRSFEEAFAEKAGHAPTTEAAFTYDGVSMVIRAIRNAGTEREAVKDELTRLTYRGITGTISFDEMGNRNCDIHFFQIRNGKAVRVSGSPD